MHSTTKISAPAEALNLLQMAGLWLQAFSQTSFWALAVWSKTQCCIMEAIKKKRYSVNAWEQFHLHVASLYFCIHFTAVSLSVKYLATLTPWFFVSRPLKIHTCVGQKILGRWHASIKQSQHWITHQTLHLFLYMFLHHYAVNVGVLVSSVSDGFTLSQPPQVV